MPTFLEFDSLVFGARQWFVLAAILLAALCLLAIWSYWRSRAGGAVNWLALALKLAAVSALAFCLLEPMRRVERPRPGANVMALVLDNSRSMEIRPPGTGDSTIDRIRPLLSSEQAWQTRLAQDFDVRRYLFDDTLRASESLEAVDSQGNSSALGSAITTLKERFANRPVAGLMLFSDGLATDDLQRLLNTELAFPIYPVLHDATSNVKDISVTDAMVTLSSFELAPATIEATIHSTGLANRDIVVKLTTQAGEVVESNTLQANSDSFSQRVRFRYRPLEPGVQFVRLTARLKSESNLDAAAPSRVEVTTANNTSLLTLARGGGPFRLLYVAGRPNWEYKFLRRSLEADVELDLDAIVRIARKEPKFSFRDRGIESVNPLIAGFSDDEETAEQYDEPVLLTPGDQAGRLAAGFPSSEEDLFQYHAIILDDIEAAFFTQQQMLLIRQFVADRGGGLMLLGGSESFSGGQYADTPLSDLSPVYITRSRSNSKTQSPTVRLELTREGALEPWLRLRAAEGDERKRVDRMPSFQAWNQVGEEKPGASVLAVLQTSDSGDQQQPGLVAQRFGKGRTLAVVLGDLWRWSMHRQEKDADDLAQAWRQIARWLTNDVPQRIEVEVTAPRQATEPHQIEVQLRDPSYQPLDNATVMLNITDPSDSQVQVTAIADARRPGFYLADYFSQLDGAYRCSIDATGPDGERLEPRESGWTAQPSASEFQKVVPNQQVLRQLATDSGGEVVPIEQLQEFVKSLPNRRMPVTESKLEPLWHRPWLMLLAICCLCIEWGIRRWKGMP